MPFRVWPVLILCVALAGCLGRNGENSAFADVPGGGRTLSRIQPGSEALHNGRRHFARQEYGLAEKYFRQAVEEHWNNTDAWIGLAASYDHLRRFDLADRAYKVVIKQVGYTATLHNNLGYHYYLQGKMQKARKHFLAAYRLDPENPYVLQNLELVEAELPRSRR